MTKKSLTYKKAGVDYDVMDTLKRMAQIEGKRTSVNLHGSKMKELSESRGESAYVVEFGDSYLAFVEEGLGTKNIVADEIRRITNKTYYDSLAQDTVAMIVNDVITVGARPIAVLAYWATGSSEWFDDLKRMEDLTSGWARACHLAGAVWGGGETPVLSGIIKKGKVDLAGACFGIIKSKRRITLGQRLQIGDSIVLLASSGIHANGLTLARKIVSRLPRRYETEMDNGEMYGESLLKPTIIYSKLIQSLFNKQVDIHYLVNITGHGWRKIMRFSKPFTYRITSLPPVPQVLKFIQKKGPVSDKESYSNFNMGAGFAIFIPSHSVNKVLKLSQKHKIKAYHAGYVEKGPKRVILEPKRIVFEEESMRIKA